MEVSLSIYWTETLHTTTGSQILSVLTIGEHVSLLRYLLISRLTLVDTANVGNTTSVIVQAGYLVRSVYIEGTALHIDGDLNATVPIKVIGAPSSTKDLHFNSVKLDFTTDPVTGEWSSTLTYTPPTLNIPDLSTLDWKYVDDLPEIQSSYDDSAWTVANHTTSNNPYTLRTPTSLYSCDYGYNTGVLIYRGHFVANGAETTFSVHTEGGSAYGSSVWIGSTYIGSWPGIDASSDHNDTYTLPNLVSGKTYVITVVVDNNGLDENWTVGPDGMKDPRGTFFSGLYPHYFLVMSRVLFLAWAHKYYILRVEIAYNVPTRCHIQLQDTSLHQRLLQRQC